MKQRPIGYRSGQVGRKTAPRGIGVVDAENVAFAVEAHLIADQEIVPLSGGRHVVVAVGADLDRAAGPLGGDRGKRCKLVALRFLAAEAAAHAADLHRHRVAGHAQRVADHVLHLARVLRRTIDGDVVVLTGDGHGNLALQVEMVLAAKAHLPGDAARRGLDCRLRVAALQGEIGGDQPVLRGVQPDDVDNRGQFRVLDLGQLAGAARLLARLGDDTENRLAPEVHLALCQHRLVVPPGRRDIVHAGHVLMCQHRDHARRGTHRIEIDLRQLAMRDGRQAEAAMQRACRLRHVVDIDGLAADMLVRRIVAHVGVHAAGNLFGLEAGLVGGHWMSPKSRMRWSAPSTAFGGSPPPCTGEECGRASGAAAILPCEAGEGDRRRRWRGQIPRAFAITLPPA